jgi:hypothetical protein
MVHLVLFLLSVVLYVALRVAYGLLVIAAMWKFGIWWGLYMGLAGYLLLKTMVEAEGLSDYFYRFQDRALMLLVLLGIGMSVHKWKMAHPPATALPAVDQDSRAQVLPPLPSEGLPLCLHRPHRAFRCLYPSRETAPTRPLAKRVP